MLCAGACSTEHRPLAVTTAEDACTRYGLPVTSADHIRCREQVAISRQPTIADIGASAAELIATSQAACDAYGVPRDTAEFNRCVQDEFAARRPG
jgi:hypothetical protein